MGWEEEVGEKVVVDWAKEMVEDVVVEKDLVVVVLVVHLSRHLQSHSFDSDPRRQSSRRRQVGPQMIVDSIVLVLRHRSVQPSVDHDRI